MRIGQSIVQYCRMKYNKWISSRQLLAQQCLQWRADNPRSKRYLQPKPDKAKMNRDSRIYMLCAFRGDRILWRGQMLEAEETFEKGVATTKKRNRWINVKPEYEREEGPWRSKTWSKMNFCQCGWKGWWRCGNLGWVYDSWEDLVELTVGSCDLHRSVCVGRLITNLAKHNLFQIHITWLDHWHLLPPLTRQISSSALFGLLFQQSSNYLYQVSLITFYLCYYSLYTNHKMTTKFMSSFPTWVDLEEAYLSGLPIRGSSLNLPVALSDQVLHPYPFPSSLLDEWC